MEENDKRGNAGSRTAFHIEELAQLLQPSASWEDLALNQTTVSRLRDICKEAKPTDPISGGIRSDRLPSRNKGFTILFSGPPGSGKRLAAEVIASELGLALYRIDLGTVVNKYIGETEKNLIDLLDAAQIADAILLFDEADALFGERTKTPDSHVRFADIPIGHLLQRMETFEGIVIFAANSQQNLDDAFRRRFRIFVAFSHPRNEPKDHLWEMVWRWLRNSLLKG